MEASSLDLHKPPYISLYLRLSPEAWKRAALPNPYPSTPYPYPGWCALTSPPTPQPRLVCAHYEGEPRGEWAGGEGPVLLRGLRAATHDPGARGVSAALSECLVAYELLQLQRKQQSQLMLTAAFHEARHACATYLSPLTLTLTPSTRRVTLTLTLTLTPSTRRVVSSSSSSSSRSSSSSSSSSGRSSVAVCMHLGHGHGHGHAHRIAPHRIAGTSSPTNPTPTSILTPHPLLTLPIPLFLPSP